MIHQKLTKTKTKMIAITNALEKLLNMSHLRSKQWITCWHRERNHKHWV